jgi:hypothetical protein
LPKTELILLLFKKEKWKDEEREVD